MLTNALQRISISLNTLRATTKLHSINSGLTSIVIRLGLAAFLIFALGNYNANAQQAREISGTVTDESDDSPLPGVNITIPGTATGTSTNAEGFYSLNVPADSDTLVFSFIGYITQRISINNRSQIDVSLSPDIQQFEDVVVVGYGVQRQREATGAILSVDADDFNQGVISSPEQLLQGRIAGVQITTASGEPGAGANIRIRGTSSLRAGNQPLYVVDGVPLSGTEVTPGGSDFGAGTQSARNPLSFLNPDDIESISVLKDASSAAIYGARGSNGVVLITTKSGAAEGYSLTVNSSMSVSNIREKIDLVSADDYVNLATDAQANPDVVNFGSATDWQDEIFRTGVSHDQNISYSSGTESGSYRVSLGYADVDGIVERSSQERLSARLNATQSLVEDRITLDLNLVTSRLNDRYAPVGNSAGFEGDLIGAALQANPTRPVFNDNGGYLQSSDFRNPVAMLNYIDDDSETSRILASLSGTVDFTEWLSYQVNFAYDNADAVRRTGVDPSLHFSDLGYDTDLGRSRGRAVVDNRYVNTQLIENTLNMQQPLGGGQIDVLAGFSYQRFENRGDFLQAEYFITDEIPLVDNVGGVNNEDNKAFIGSSYRSVEELQSFFGRVNYNYQDRYLLTANFRADGSTKFGRDNKYGYFPSLSVAWRLSEEDFFSGLSSTFSDFKLRGSYGITGNQEYPGGASLAIFRTNNDGSITQTNNPNPDIQWEETAQWGIGADFEIYEGRFGGSIDYFNKQTENLIFRQDFAQPAAVEYQWVNLDGTILNTGLEIALNAFMVNSTNVSWQVQYNMSFLKNEIKDLDTFVNTGAIHGQGLSGAYAQRIAEGQPLYAFYMREFEGFDENGLGIYANNEELAFVGDPLPDVTLGLANNFTFGRFDASVFLEGSFGFQIYNNTANAIFLKGNLRNGRNVTYDIANSVESPNNFGEASTRFLEDGDFIRLSNLSIGYNVDVTTLTNAIRGLRLNVTGQNLFVITDYSGFDPEVNTDKAINGVPSLGIDYTAYPRARTVTFGVRLDI